MEKAQQNNDKIIYKVPAQGWKEEGYTPTLFITPEGFLGIQVGGMVKVRPIEEWFRRGMDEKLAPLTRGILSEVLDGVVNLRLSAIDAEEYLLKHFGQTLGNNIGAAEINPQATPCDIAIENHTDFAIQCRVEDLGSKVVMHIHNAEEKV